MRWIEAAALAMAAMTAGAQQQNPPATPLPRGPAVPTVPAPAAPPATQPPPFIVVVDAAHGGSDVGAKMSSGALEKDIVLGLAGRLRSTLRARGIEVTTTRTGDVNLGAQERAEAANRAQAAACCRRSRRTFIRSCLQG